VTTSSQGKGAKATANWKVLNLYSNQLLIGGNAGATQPTETGRNAVPIKAAQRLISPAQPKPAETGGRFS
jgi:hypothetical protein